MMFKSNIYQILFDTHFIIFSSMSSKRFYKVRVRYVSRKIKDLKENKIVFKQSLFFFSKKNKILAKT